jgi:chemotaxis protein MotB
MAPPPIIIIKKKSGHGGHHGGAWKVAYADFVTAMMALFIVLWLLSSSSKQTQVAISGYFKDPNGTASKAGTNLAGTGETIPLAKTDLAKLKEILQKRIQSIADLEKLNKNIEITVTSEGLRIELIESEKGTFFESGSAALNKNGQEMIALLAAELAKVPNDISIEGHTDAKPFTGKNIYSNWELSSDRANAARRLMQQARGLRADQVKQVRGFADQRLRNLKDPLDPSNRRISIIVQNLTSKVDETDEEGGNAAPGEKPPAEGAKAEKDISAKPSAAQKE